MLNIDINSVSIVNENYSKIILKNIKLEIEKGKIYTILGKNGSGKSTLIKSLTALLPADQYEIIGNVFLEKTDLLLASPDSLRNLRSNNIRYVFQDVANSLDPLKKIKYYFDLTNTTAEEIEEQLNFFLLPGYRKLSGLYSYELSGGMAQRLLIVLAFLAKPDLIILDEPTSGVDYAITNLLLLKLTEFIKTKDKSILIVTQDINFALKSSDYISYLFDGSLSPCLKPNDFLHSANSDIKEFINSFNEISNASS